jgi:hypothetical protein
MPGAKHLKLKNVGEATLRATDAPPGRGYEGDRHLPKVVAAQNEAPPKSPRTPAGNGAMTVSPSVSQRSRNHLCTRHHILDKKAFTTFEPNPAGQSPR